MYFTLLYITLKKHHITSHFVSVWRGRLHRIRSKMLHTLHKKAVKRFRMLAYMTRGTWRAAPDWTSATQTHAFVFTQTSQAPTLIASSSQLQALSCNYPTSGTRRPKRCSTRSARRGARQGGPRRGAQRGDWQGAPRRCSRRGATPHMSRSLTTNV